MPAKKKDKLFGEPVSKVIKRPGALTRKAKAKGMTVKQFCARLPKSADTRTKRQCNLAKTLRGFRK